jgi:hypothetical protein
MNLIRIPVTLSPHIVKGSPRGYYVLAQRLFPNGAPILAKAQWIGFNGALVITVEHPHEWDSLLKMAVKCPDFIEGRVSWLAPAKVWPMSKGFRTYIPGTILKPKPAEASKVESMGTFQQVGSIFYLSIPAIDGEVLLGRKEIEDD